MLIELVGRQLRPWELNPRPFVILTQWFITEPQELLPAGSSGLPKSTTSQARFLHFLPHEEESGECYTSHPDPAVTGQAVTGSGPGPCVPLAWSLGAWLVLQSVSVAQLCDSVRPVRPAIRIRWSGISVQGPALRAIPVASCLHQSHGGDPCSPERTGCAHPQLPRWLAHTCAVSRAVVRTQGPSDQAPQPVGSSGQLRKEPTRANAEDLFSRHGVGFSQPDSTPHPGTCSVGAELPQDFIRKDGGPTETFSEAPGVYGHSCGDSSVRSDPCETASAESWGGHGNAVLTGFRLHRPVAQPSARGEIPCSFRQECPWRRYPGILWCSRMPRPPAGEPRTTGTQCQGYRRVPTVLVYQLSRVAGSMSCPEPL